jgi:hypothetical protein
MQYPPYPTLPYLTTITIVTDTDNAILVNNKEKSHIILIAHTVGLGISTSTDLNVLLK